MSARTEGMRQFALTYRVWHNDFALDGCRYRGSTKEKILSKARMAEALLMNEAKRRKLTVQRRTLTLAEFSKRFLDWVKMTRLAPCGTQTATVRHLIIMLDTGMRPGEVFRIS